MISSELTRLRVDFKNGDLDDVITRSQALFDRIAARPNALAETPDDYFQSAAMHIQALSVRGRFRDALPVVEIIFDEIVKINHDAVTNETLSTLCSAMCRAAFCASQLTLRNDAFRYLHQASALLEPLDDHTTSVLFYIALSATFASFGGPKDHALASEYGLTAVQLSQQHNVYEYIPLALSNLIHFSNVEGKFDNSLQYAQALLAYFDGFDQEPHFTEDFLLTRSYISLHTNIGDAWRGKGEPLIATRYYNKGIALNEKHGPHDRVRIFQHQGLGHVEMQLGNYDAAIEHFQTAADAGDSVGQLAIVKECNKNLSDALQANGDFEQALRYANLVYEQDQLILGEGATASHQNLKTTHRSDEPEESNLREALAQKDEHLSMFTSIMSHDVKSPLFIIRMCADLIKQNPASADHVKAQSDFISDAAESIGSLLDDLVLYSKTDANVDIAALSTVDLNQVVAATVSGLKREISASGAEVTVGDLPSVLGDQSLLGALFKTLITNGLTYQPKDAPGHQAKVDIKANVSDVGEPVIRVDDNGIGFPEEARDDLFKSFTRFHSSDYEGNGLGMAICKRVMHLHNGDIELASTSENGSSFRLSFAF